MSNLTEKFAALSNDVASYIAGVNASLDTLQSTIQFQSTKIDTMATLLADINVTMTQILACVCRTADGLSDFLDQNTPPTPSPCADPQADAGMLIYDTYYPMVNGWIYRGGTSPRQYTLDMGGLADLPGATLNAGGAQPGIVLVGPKWYEIRFYVSQADLQWVNSLQFRYGTQIDNYGPVSEGTSQLQVFVAASSLVEIRLMSSAIEADPPLDLTISINPCTGGSQE